MLRWLVLEHFQWGSAESIELTLARKSTLGLPVAVVKVYFGSSYVDHTTPLPNALVLRWLVLEHFQWGSAESTALSLAHKSTLRLPVAAVKVYLSSSYVDHTTSLPNDLLLRWLVLEHFQ